MEQKMVRIEEDTKKGTRGGTYFYMVEGNELIHVGDFSARELLGKHGQVTYEVPANILEGKVLYCFYFSRSGGAFLGKCEVEDFEDGRPQKYECFGPLSEYINEISDLKFRTKNINLVYLLEQFKQSLIPMINDIKQYERKKNFEISFRRHQARLANAFENPDLYYFAFMSLPSDRSRIASFRVTRRWIYELWITSSLLVIS